MSLMLTIKIVFKKAAILPAFDTHPSSLIPHPSLLQNGGQNCPGPATQQQACNTPVNGAWGPWPAYSQCVNGQQIRTRLCNNPAPQVIV